MYFLFVLHVYLVQTPYSAAEYDYHIFCLNLIENNFVSAAVHDLLIMFGVIEDIMSIVMNFLIKA